MSGWEDERNAKIQSKEKETNCNLSRRRHCSNELVEQGLRKITCDKLKRRLDYRCAKVLLESEFT